MSFAARYEKRRTAFEKELTAFLPKLQYPSPLGEAVRYALTSGGKRLRPILLLESAQLFTPENEQAISLAAIAVESLHTYSLIHDDLPCMDNDDFRRGKQTCHKVFGEANALLAGDALLNLAYECMFESSLLGENGKAAGLLLAKAASGSGLIGGQVADLQPNADKESVAYIYRNKTGALITAALEMGAVLGGATSAERQKIVNFGQIFGFCFQLQDDLLDKETDADKKTYLNLYGEEETKRILKEKTSEAIACIADMHGTEFLIELTENFMERTE
ncbi:MAG: polyprenyl synthetase family protein [Clostridiales bacterium]|nr:polyprenyl synthetase family protein [Clostridiales bacterium]